MELELNELFGLPAHPLVVHAVVVLLPLAAITTLLSAAMPKLRRHYAPLALALALVATLAVVLAQGSGEELEDRVDETELVEEHTGSGERVLPWAIALTVAAVALNTAPLVARRRPTSSASTATGVLVALALISGAGATWTVIDVGHSGARATWEEVGDE